MQLRLMLDRLVLDRLLTRRRRWDHRCFVEGFEVSVQMALQVVTFGESLAARLALMSFLAGVGQHVPGQHMTVGESFAAGLEVEKRRS